MSRQLLDTVNCYPQIRVKCSIVSLAERNLRPQWYQKSQASLHFAKSWASCSSFVRACDFSSSWVWSPLFPAGWVDVSITWLPMTEVMVSLPCLCVAYRTSTLQPFYETVLFYYWCYETMNRFHSLTLGLESVNVLQFLTECQLCARSSIPGKELICIKSENDQTLCKEV